MKAPRWFFHAGFNCAPYRVQALVYFIKLLVKYDWRYARDWAAAKLSGVKT